jgi:hypothetical protein
MDEELRLVIKKIPTKLTEYEMKDILNKAIKGEYFNVQYVKPAHKYFLKHNNLCFVSIKTMDARIKLEEFLLNYELINKEGVKHKLELDLCIIPPKVDPPIIQDSKINNTYSDLIHFQKFKEAFEADDLVKFKQEESKCKELVYYTMTYVLPIIF